MFNDNNAIEVKNITKSFKVYYDKGNQLKEKLLFRSRNRYEKRQVLNGITFSVKKGEAIGLIGHNGCGKSTTLKLLTRIIYPDTGTIEMCGRVSSLIELGAGFHPDMTGRENIYTNAAIFGLNKKEIDERIQDIIDFSELEEFIDNPVRTYSSGMYMRLAFSVAINVDADILLIDEILAVGDAGFQTKCFNRLKEIKAAGTTIVIVSHSLGQIEQICDRSIWIHEGMIKEEGEPRKVHPLYMDYVVEERKEIAEKEFAKKQKKKEQIDEKKGVVSENAIEGVVEDSCALIDEKKRWGNGKVKIKSVKLYNDKKETYTFVTGEKMCVEITYEAISKVEMADIGIAIVRIDGIHCYGTNTRIDRIPDFDIDSNGQMIINIERMQLLPGQYLIDIAIEDGGGMPVDYWREAVKFDVYSQISDVGIVRLEHNWVNGK